MKLTSEWQQVDGDMDPATYGATIARLDGDYIEVLQIQPVRTYVGGREAVEVGFPFWSKAGYYDRDDLTADDMLGALSCGGMDPDDLPDDDGECLLVLACAALDYGYRADEGPAGFARDVLGNDRVQWWGSKRPCGWRYLASEDQEFRALVRESRRSCGK